MQKKLSIGKSAEKWERLKRDLPKKVAARCVSFFLDSFRKEGWTDSAFKSWRPRIAKKKKNSTKNLLVGKGTLRRMVNASTRMATWDLIKFEVDLPYASIHNEGFNGNENVKAHKRKQKAKVQVSSVRTRHKTTVKATVGETEVKAFVRHMKMPQRKYMGDSKALRKIIIELIQKEIAKIFP